MKTIIASCFAVLLAGCVLQEAVKVYQLNTEMETPPGGMMVGWRPENSVTAYYLTYLGLNGSTLNVEYAEKKYQAYGPYLVATQPLSFNISKDSTIVCRTVKIRVLSVDNTGIRYIVLNDPPGMVKH